MFNLLHYLVFVMMLTTSISVDVLQQCRKDDFMGDFTKLKRIPARFLLIIEQYILHTMNIINL